MANISKNNVKAVFILVQLEDGEIYQVVDTQENCFKALKKYIGRSKKLSLFDDPLPIEIKNNEES